MRISSPWRSRSSLTLSHCSTRHTRDFRYPREDDNDVSDTHARSYISFAQILWSSLRNLERQVVAPIFLHRPLCTALNLILLPFFFPLAPIKLKTHTHFVELFRHFFPGCAPCIFLGLAWLLLDGKPVFLFPRSARAAHVNSNLSTTTTTTATTAVASIFTLCTQKKREEIKF